MMHVCVIPKLFPYDEFLSGMKLTRNKLIEVIRRKNEGWTTYQARKIAGISIRRVNQVWKEYQISGEIPEIGKKNGRPSKPLSEEEIDMVKQTYLKYKVSADTLEKLIDRDYHKHIGHNRIHKALVYLGFAQKKKWKDIRKKNWIRYERRHSLTAVHIDWYLDSITRKYIFAVIDDASRKLLALIECESPTTEASIEGMEIALTHGKIKQCISDHGAQFISNIGGDSKFKEFLDFNEIKQILCRIKHPQSNGKVEKFFSLYKAKRSQFQTKEEFIIWYNELRPHKSLNFEVLETPEQAFVRKLKAEA
jgi:putative transposase